MMVTQIEISNVKQLLLSEDQVNQELGVILAITSFGWEAKDIANFIVDSYIKDRVTFLLKFSGIKIHIYSHTKFDKQGRIKNQIYCIKANDKKYGTRAFARSKEVTKTEISSLYNCAKKILYKKLKQKDFIKELTNDNTRRN